VAAAALAQRPLVLQMPPLRAINNDAAAEPACSVVFWGVCSCFEFSVCRINVFAAAAKARERERRARSRAFFVLWRAHTQHTHSKGGTSKRQHRFANVLCCVVMCALLAVFCIKRSVCCCTPLLLLLISTKPTSPASTWVVYTRT
jgi:hypothetical protein